MLDLVLTMWVVTKLGGGGGVKRGIMMVDCAVWACGLTVIAKMGTGVSLYAPTHTFYYFNSGIAACMRMSIKLVEYSWITIAKSKLISLTIK